jgi:hypothetical protein
MTGTFAERAGQGHAMRFVLALIGCVACGGAPSPNHAVSIQPLATTPTTAQSAIARPRAPAMTVVVVTNAPYAAIALWRPHASGQIEPIAFPWAELHNLDTVTPSPDGREIAYVEGGSAYGPLLVRELTNGSKTVVAAFVPGRELLVAAWSPSGRKILYAERRAGQLRSDCHWSGCPQPGPKSYRVYDRDTAKTTPIDVPAELVAWLPSGDVIVANDDGGGDLARVDETTKTKTPVASGPRFHSGFSVDAAKNRVLSTAWNDQTKRDEILSLDLATWHETAIAPPAPYATYLHPAASASGKRIAWLASTYAAHVHSVFLVVDGKPLVGPSGDLVGFEWIDDGAIVAHYRNRLDVVDLTDASVVGSIATNADDMIR